jgi:hypothetical protein
MVKVGRNEPCPCGSGKKYKKCCLMKTFTSPGREESIKKKLVEDLLKLYKQTFYADRLDDTMATFWGDFKPAEHLKGESLELAELNFWEWIIYDWVDEGSSKSLIDLHLEKTKTLSVDEHRVLTMMKNSFISLYEVQDVYQDKGLLLKDLVLGGEHNVREKSATVHLSRGDILATRLLQVDDHYIMSSALYPYPLKVRNDILANIHSQYERYREEHQGAVICNFLKFHGEYFNCCWYNLIQNPTSTTVIAGEE